MSSVNTEPNSAASKPRPSIHSLFTVAGEILGAVAVFLALFQMLWIPWSTGETTYFSIGGYLPWSDASWWFNGGLRLLLDGKLNGLSATRIVNEVFFAALLGISGQHLQLVLILRTVLIAVATFLFVREVAHRLGVMSAVATAILMVAFIGGYTRTTMSEPTGFLYGVLGSTLLQELTTRSHSFLPRGFSCLLLAWLRARALSLCCRRSFCGLAVASEGKGASESGRRSCLRLG